jgi:uncharacterized protein (TIGR03083 family)
MAKVPQYYGAGGAPLDVEIDPASVAPVWFAHRERLTGWLAALPAPAWAGPTRCEGWTVGVLVRHLASVAQFAGFTLHAAAKGTATRLLEDFDPAVTPGTAAEMLGDPEPGPMLDAMREADARIAATVSGWTAHDWEQLAEAPQGNVPAYLSLTHFLFDSWVHEYDLLLPRDEVPVVLASEVEIVVPYVLGLAGVVGGEATTADVQLTDVDLEVGLTVQDGRAVVRSGWVPDGAPVIRGTAAAVVDVATGRVGPTTLDADPAATDVLTRFAALLR